MGRRGIPRVATTVEETAPLLQPTPVAAVSLTEALGLSGPMDSCVEQKRIKPIGPEPEGAEAPTSLTEYTFQFILHCFVAPVFVGNLNHWLFSKHLSWYDWDVLYQIRGSFWKDIGAWVFMTVVAKALLPSVYAYFMKKLRRLYSWRIGILKVVGSLTYFVCLTHALGLAKKIYHLSVTYWQTGEWRVNRRVFSHRFDDVYMDWATNHAWDDRPLELALHKSVGLRCDFSNFMYGMYIFFAVHFAALFLYVTVPYIYNTWYKGFRLRIVHAWRSYKRRKA